MDAGQDLGHNKLSPLPRLFYRPDGMVKAAGIACIGAVAANDPENPILVCLRRLDGKMDRLGEDMRDVRDRLTSVEERLSGVEKSVARFMGILPVDRGA